MKLIPGSTIKEQNQLTLRLDRRNVAQSNFSKNFNAKLGPVFIKPRSSEKVR